MTDTTKKTESGEAVAWAIRLRDGSISSFGWNGMPLLEGMKRMVKLVDGAEYVYAYTTPPAAQVQPCDMGALCIGCTPRNADGSCPEAAQVQQFPQTREELIPLAREVLRRLGVIDDLLDAAIRRCEDAQVQQVDENGCYTAADGECISRGPCVHSANPAAGDKVWVTDAMVDTMGRAIHGDETWASGVPSIRDKYKAKYRVGLEAALAQPQEVGRG